MNKFKFHLLCFAISFASFVTLTSNAIAQEDVGAVATKPPTDVVLKSVPDLLQTFKKAEFAGGGKQFCGPVCVSNSLVWLEGKSNRKHQIEVVKKLASKDFMNTNLTNGTGTRDLMRGVERYAQELWPEFHRLEYAGWRPALDGHNIAKKPTLNWITDGLHDKAAVWVNVGWYVADENVSGSFERKGGHWVTCVGHKNGRLVFHDPAPRAGASSQKELVAYDVLGEGQLTGKKRGLPADAAGYIRLGKGMHISSRGDTAIIDGVVILEIEKPEPIRKWVSANGKFSIEAKYLSHGEGKVTLQPVDGSKKIDVKLSVLGKEDQEYVESK